MSNKDFFMLGLTATCFIGTAIMSRVIRARKDSHKEIIFLYNKVKDLEEDIRKMKEEGINND